MLDNVIDSWILQARTSTCSLVFSCLESLKTPKKTRRGSFFIQFSLLRPEKYKTYHRRTLLSSEELSLTFFILSHEGPKKVKLPSTQRSFKSNLQLQFYECEGKQDHSERSIWLREMGLTTINLLLCSLVFNEHDKGIKYAQNIFHVYVQSMKKRKLISYRALLFHNFGPLGPKK